MKSISVRLLALMACGLFASVASAEPNPKTDASKNKGTGRVAPLSQRFAKADTPAVPDFQKHVVPLLGRLGCNGRACHGSFQGRGGFQLSLFGYDFKADHDAMLDEATGRVDTDDVAESLILAKPSDADLHEGGKRFELGSWQHHVLKRWVETGAKYNAEKILKLQELEVVPSELVFKRTDQNVNLKVFAHWEDGSVEDVTEICRFSSNNDAVAAINEQGRVSSGEQGDTHVVVYYDKAVVPVPVMRPMGPPTSPNRQAKPIDQLIQQKLTKLGVTPSGLCTDAEFIRRASLDITGILPTGDRVREFLADESTNKRQALVNELLESPGYSAWWATRFSDWTGNSEEQLNNVLPVRGAGTRIWHEWLRERLANNVPYDQIIEGIVSGDNRNQGETYLDFCESMTEACKPGKESEFAKREGMPLYWARRNFAKPEERAIGFAYTFLGVRIECAQCHKHPFDQWSKNDFDQFAKLFTPIRFNQNLVKKDAKADRDKLVQEITGGKNLKGGDLRRAVQQASRGDKVLPFGELLVNTSTVNARVKKQRELAKKKGRKLPPLNIPNGTILGGEKLTLDQDPRPALMRWLRSPENPYFAKAIVNRVWSNYFGVGIVNPTDDMNLANPPSNAALLDHLASEFIKREFDLKWLHREIANSDAYQRSADTNSSNEMDRINFSHHIPRRLPAEVVYDSVILATGSDSATSSIRANVDAMAIADGKARNRNRSDYALEVFGQSIRETNCDCDRSDAPSLLQSVYLRNDSEMHKRLGDKAGWVAQACKSLGVPGPKGAFDPKQAGLERQAKSLRKQIVTRIQALNKLPEARRDKVKASLKKQYNNAVSRMKKLGYTVPAFAVLLEKPEAWLRADLEPVGVSKDAGTTKTSSVDRLVEDMYLRTLSRFPDAEEKAISLAFIDESKSTAEGLESLLWALINTKEFIISH